MAGHGRIRAATDQVALAGLCVEGEDVGLAGHVDGTLDPRGRNDRRAVEQNPWLERLEGQVVLA